MAIENIVSKDNLGNSFSLDNTAKKINLKVDNETITVGEDGTLSAAAGGGIDLDNIPEKRWKDGTTVLAKQDGELVRLNSSNIFTDVTISVTTSKSSIEEQQTFQVKYIITNSGVDVNEKTILTIVKPSSGSYTIANQSHVSSGAGSVTQDGDTYTITQLGAGGTVTVTFDVTATGYGTLSFGGQVQPVGVDVNGQNNTATTVVNVKKPVSAESSNPIPVGKSCDLIKAYDVASGKQLKTFACSAEAYGRDERIITNFSDKVNVYYIRRNLAGLQIRLEGARGVVVSSASSNQPSSSWDAHFAQAYLPSPSWSPQQNVIIPLVPNPLARELRDETIAPPHTNCLYNFGFFDPNTQIFTFRDDLTNLYNRNVNYNGKNASNVVLWIRPEGENCVWQGVFITCAQDVPPGTFTFRNNNSLQFIAVDNNQLPAIEINQTNDYNEYVNKLDNTNLNGHVVTDGYATLNYANIVDADELPEDLVYIRARSISAYYNVSSNTENYTLRVKPGMKFKIHPVTEASEKYYNPNHSNISGHISVTRRTDGDYDVVISNNASRADNVTIFNGRIKFEVIDA